MDIRTWIGTLSEQKVLTKLVEKQLHVFSQTSGKAPFDLIVLYKEKLLRINVKGTQTRSKSNDHWVVQLRSIRSNKKVNTIHLYEKESCDILAVYIEPIDKVCFFLSKDISQTSAITLNEERIKKATLEKILESW